MYMDTAGTNDQNTTPNSTPESVPTFTPVPVAPSVSPDPPLSVSDIVSPPPSSGPGKKIVTGLVVVLLLLALPVGLYLAQQQQDIRQRAQNYPMYSCESNGQCVESTTGTYDSLAACQSDCVTNPPPPPPPPPPPSPTPVAQCVNIRIYSVTGYEVGNDAWQIAENWHLLTAAELSALKPGDIIFISTTGSSTSAQITRARIRINSSDWVQTAGQKPPDIACGTSCPVEWFTTYGIPAGITSFKIESEVYSPEFDDDGDPTVGNKGWR